MVDTSWLPQPYAKASLRALFSQTGLIDYDKLEEKALDFRPQMIICGGSAYPREWEYERLRSIADKVGAYLMADMAHIRWALMRSSYVAAKCRPYLQTSGGPLRRCKLGRTLNRSPSPNLCGTACPALLFQESKAVSRHLQLLLL